MPAIVADTHAIIWYLADDPRLSPSAAAALNRASASGDPILIPSITLVELTYLVEKGRLPAAARQRLIEALADTDGPYDLAPLDGDVAEAVQRIDRAARLAGEFVGHDDLKQTCGVDFSLPCPTRVGTLASR